MKILPEANVRMKQSRLVLIKSRMTGGMRNSPNMKAKFIARRWGWNAYKIRDKTRA